jgi:hypothetical protein
MLHGLWRKFRTSKSDQELKNGDDFIGYIEQPDLDGLQANDPLMLYGYGIVAYRNIIKFLVVVFAILTALSLPMMIMYSQGEGYRLNFGKKAGNEVYSLGNLGYASVQSENIPIGVGVLTL